MVDESSGTIDDEYGNFPRYLGLVPDVFFFSFDSALKGVGRFKNHADLSNALDSLLQFVAGSELPEDQKDELMQVISEEMDVLTFAVVSRTSVVQI